MLPATQRLEFRARKRACSRPANGLKQLRRELRPLDAGHVGLELSKAAARAGFSVTVADDRESYANSARFPEAEKVIADDFEKTCAGIEPTSATYIVIATRGHRDDMRVLRWAVQTEARYIGMVGSRRKVITVYRELVKEGLKPELFERVHSPVGLDIGAVTPEEIAVSITAELIGARRKAERPLPHMSWFHQYKPASASRWTRRFSKAAPRWMNRCLPANPRRLTREPGGRVLAGSLNYDGAVVCRAESLGEATVLAQITRMVEQAQRSRAPMERLADRASAIFVPVVLVLALVTFVAWLVVTHSVSMAIANTVAVLVIACPCAMGLAVPAALTVAVGRGAQLGVLFKGGEALERLAHLDAIVLDKTGTLTAGLALRLYLLKALFQVIGDSLIYGDMAKNLLLHGCYCQTVDKAVLAQLITRSMFPAGGAGDLLPYGEAMQAYGSRDIFREPRKTFRLTISTTF